MLPWASIVSVAPCLRIPATSSWSCTARSLPMESAQHGENKGGCCCGRFGGSSSFRGAIGRQTGVERGRAGGGGGGGGSPVTCRMISPWPHCCSAASLECRALKVNVWNSTKGIEGGAGGGRGMQGHYHYHYHCRSLSLSLSSS